MPLCAMPTGLAYPFTLRDRWGALLASSVARQRGFAHASSNGFWARRLPNSPGPDDMFCGSVSPFSRICTSMILVTSAFGLPAPPGGSSSGHGLSSGHVGTNAVGKRGMSRCFISGHVWESPEEWRKLDGLAPERSRESPQAASNDVPRSGTERDRRRWTVHLPVHHETPKAPGLGTGTPARPLSESSYPALAAGRQTCPARRPARPVPACHLKKI